MPTPVTSTEPSGESRDEIQSRVMTTLFSEDIPDPRDIIIIGLAAACGVFESVLSRDELADVRERIEAISRLDLMGRTIRESMRTIKPAAPPAKTVRSHEEIPEVQGLPFAGNAFRMAGDVREFLAGNYRKHGPILRIRAFGYRFIALVTPEANVFLARISGTRLRSHEPYREFGVAMGAHRVMLNMDGPEHLRMRKLQVNGYPPKTLESNPDVAHDVTRRAIGEWWQGQPVGVQRAMQQIIAEQIGLCCTGVSPEAYIDELIHFPGMMVTVHIRRGPPAAAAFAQRPQARSEHQRRQGREGEAAAATAVASRVHHCVDGPPTVTLRPMMSMFTPSTMGIRPSTVVTAVSSTGRRGSTPVRNAASTPGGCAVRQDGGSLRISARFPPSSVRTRTVRPNGCRRMGLLGRIVAKARPRFGVNL